MPKVSSFDSAKTASALQVYASAKEKTWLQPVVRDGQEFLEARKVTFGMRVLAFFGIGWRFSDVVHFVRDHSNQIAFPAGFSTKFKYALRHYNDSYFHGKIDTAILQVLPKEKSETNVDQAKSVLQKEYQWIFSDAVDKAQIKELRNIVAKSPLPLQEPFATMKHILRRFDQLEHADFQTKALSVAERFGFAVYIELNLPVIKQVAEDTFIGMHEAFAPCEIMVRGDEKKRHFFVLSDPTLSKIQASGTSKKVYSALQVPLKRKEALESAIHAKIEIRTQDSSAIQKELTFFKQLQNEPGCVKMHLFCNVPTKKDVSEFRVIFEKFDGSLLELTKKGLSSDEVVDVARQILMAMNAIHKKQIAHMDVKLENVLYKREGGKLKVAVTDFGLATKMDARKENLNLNGSYGTTFMTAPELIGNKKFKATYDSLEKLDVWAVGILLYELYFGETVSWYDLLDTDVLTDSIRKEVEKKIEEEIEVPLKKGISEKDPMKAIIFQMLRRDPEKRITMSEALTQVLAVSSS